jgi:hypothetical protein
MHFKSIFVAGLIAGTTAMMPCLAPPPTDEDLARFEAVSDMEANSTFRALSQAVTYVDTYVHVVASSRSSSDGYLSVSQSSRSRELRTLS